MEIMQVDKLRTETLKQPDLLVVSDCGDDHMYYTVLKDDNPGKCPKCGGNHVKINATDTRTINDVIISSSGKATFVKVEVKFRRYLCLNSVCKTQYTADMNFAEPRSRNSKRLEDLIVRMALWMPIYQVPNNTGNVMTDTAVKKLLNRWIIRKDAEYTNILPEIIGIHSMEINGISRTVIVDPVNQYLLDILNDAGADTFESWLMKKDITHVKMVVRDLVTSYVDVVTKLLPQVQVMTYTPSIINMLEDALKLAEKRKKNPDTEYGRVLITRLQAIDKYSQDFDLNAWAEKIAIYKPFSAFAPVITADKEYIRTYLKNKPSFYTAKYSLSLLMEYANKTHGCNFPAIRARLLYSKEKRRKVCIDKDTTKTVTITSIKEILQYLISMEDNIVKGGQF